MPTVANLVTPSWWSAYSTNYSTEGATARRVQEELYRADVPDAPSSATYKGYVYTTAGLLEGASSDVAVPERALYLKHGDGSYFTIDFGDNAKVSLVDSNENLELYVYKAAGSVERWDFDSSTGNMVGNEPTELSALEVSTVEKNTKVDIDFDANLGATISETLASSGKRDSLFKLNVLGTDVYAVGSRLDPSRGIDVNDHALMADADNLWEPDEDYDNFSMTVRTLTIVDEPAVDAVRDDDGNLVSRAVAAVTHQENRYDVYLTLDPDSSRNFEGETLRLTFDDARVLIETGDDAPAYLDYASLARDEAVTGQDHNADGAVGLNISTTAVDVTGQLYTGSILEQDFYVFGKFDGHDSSTEGASLSGALLEADGEVAWEAWSGFSIVSGLDTSFEDDNGDMVQQRTVLLQNDNNANEVLRFDFELHTSDLTNARGEAVTSFKLIEDEYTGKELTPQELAALERQHQRDLDQDGNFGVGMATDPIDEEGGLQLANALGVQFLIASRRAISSERSPLDLATAFTYEANTDGSRDSWLPDNVDDLTSSNINLVTTSDSNGDRVYEIYVGEDSSTGGAFARYTFNSDFELTEDRYELTDDELAAAEVEYGRNLNADEYTYSSETKESFGVVITEAFLDTKSGLYSAEFAGESMFIKSDSRLNVGSFSEKKAVDFDSVLHDDIGGVWSLSDFKIESDMSVTGAVQEDDSFFVFATSASDAGLVQKFKFEEDATSGRWTLTGTEHDTLLSLADLSTLESDHRKDLNGDDYEGAILVSVEDKTSGLAKVRMAGTDFYVVEPTRSDLSRLNGALYANDQQDAWTPDESTFTSMVAVENPDEATELFVYVVNQPIDDSNDPDYDNYSYSRYTFDADTGVLATDSRVAIELIELAEQEVATGRDINGDRSIGAKVEDQIDRVGGLYSTQIDGTTVYAASDSKQRALDLGAHAFLDENGEQPWTGVDSGYQMATLVVDDSDNTYAIYATATSGGFAADVKVYRFDENRNFVDSADVGSVTIGDDKGLVELEMDLDRDLNNDRGVGQLRDDTIDRRGGLFSTTVMGDTFYTIGSNVRTGRSADTAIDFSMSLFDATGQNAWEPSDGYTIAGVVANTNSSDEVESYSVFSYTDADSDGDPEDVQETVWNVSGDTLAYSTSKSADAVRLVELEKAERRDLSGDGVVGFRLNATANSADDRDYFGVSKAKIYGDFSVFLAGEDLRQGLRSNPLAQGNALLSDDGATPWSIDSGYQIVGAEVSSDGTERYVYGKLTTDEFDTRAEFVQYTFARDTGIVQGFEEISRHTLMEREVAAKADLTADGNIGIKLATLSEINNDAGKWTGLIQASVGIGGETTLAADDATTSDVDESTPTSQAYLMLKRDPRPNKGDLSASLLNNDGTAWEMPSSDFSIKGTHVGSFDDGRSYVDVYGYESATSAEIKRFRFQERLADESLEGNWVLMTDVNNSARDLNTRELAETEAGAGKDLNGDGSIGFVYSGSAVAEQSNGVTLGTANAKQSGVTSGADEDIYIVGRNLDRMGTKTSNLANSAALFVSNGNTLNYWKPDTGFTVEQIWESNNVVNLYAQNSDDLTLKYKFESQDIDGSDTWVMSSATRASQGMPGVDIVKDEVEAGRDFNDDSFVGLDIGTAPVVGLFNASVEDDDFLIVGADLVDGTASNPTGFTGVLLGDGDTPWAPPENYEVLALIQNGNETRVFITNDTPVHDGNTAIPSILKLSFNGGNNGEFGDVSAFHISDDSKLIDVTTLDDTEDDADDADVYAANQAAIMTVDKLIAEEVNFKTDLDGNGAVGMTISATPVVDGVYTGTAYDQTAVMVSIDNALQTGTLRSPTSLNGAIVQNTAADGDPEVYELWAAGDDETVTAAQWGENGIISFYVKDTSGDSDVVKKYSLSEIEENSAYKRVLDTGDDGSVDLTGASLINEEVNSRRDLDGDGIVGVEISSTASDHISGQLYKGSGLNDDEVFYLVGYGLESGTQSRPLGLTTALRDEDDSDGNAVYWKPADGVTLEDFEKISNESFSQAVIDAIQDGDADNGEEEAPGTAEYAALLDTSGTASVAFFDSNYQLITS